jgi:hypothetical protein
VLLSGTTVVGAVGELPNLKETAFFGNTSIKGFDI